MARANSGNFMAPRCRLAFSDALFEARAFEGGKPKFGATFIFVTTILGVTQKNAPSQLAGLAIGLTLTAIHIVGIQVTGVSVNPARSLGPAVWVLGDAIGQLWLFIAAPMVGAALAGCAFRVKLFSEDD